MSQDFQTLEDTGLEVIDLQDDPAFGLRQLRPHDALRQMEAMQRLGQCFVESPETILQELVNAAVELCGAESAGISLERADGTDESYYIWVATAGEYASFSNATLPRYPSACGVCIERGRPQLYRVSPRFFELMGVDAKTVTDGILIPWRVEEMRGTLWIMAHGRTEAFDSNDVRLMQALGNFAAMGVRQQRLHNRLMQQASSVAAVEMANDLAHEINNPLQGLTNLLYLAVEEQDETGARKLAQKMMGDFDRLSFLVKRLPELPKRKADAARLA